RQAVDLVRPDFDSAPTPSDVQVGVMALLFGDGANPIGERHRAGEIAKLVRAKQVTGWRHGPARLELTQQRVDAFARQRRHTAATRNALLVGEGHRLSPCTGDAIIPLRGSV